MSLLTDRAWKLVKDLVIPQNSKKSLIIGKKYDWREGKDRSSSNKTKIVVEKRRYVAPLKGLGSYRPT